jgi:hypothetical protein
MEKYIGQPVELVTTHADGGTETTKATLVGIQNGYVYQLENGKIAVNPPGHVVLPALPSGLISKPSLVWMLESSKPKQNVEASYLTVASAGRRTTWRYSPPTMRSSTSPAG